MEKKVKNAGRKDCELARELVPITILVSKEFKSALERESIRQSFNSVSEMVRDKLRFCLPQNIRNLISVDYSEKKNEP